MTGVNFQVEAKLPAPDGGYAEEAERFIHLAMEHPFGAGLLFICIVIILILMPGGVGPASVKYRGAVRQQEQRRITDVKDIVTRVGKRAGRRQRGKAKGQIK
jgi:hypothetical protein